VIVSKFEGDNSIIMRGVSQALKVPLQEICILEREFLRLIDYSVYTSTEEYQQVLESLKDFFTCQWNQDLISNAVREAEQSIFYRVNKKKFMELAEDYAAVKVQIANTLAVNKTGDSSIPALILMLLGELDEIETQLTTADLCQSLLLRSQAETMTSVIHHHLCTYNERIRGMITNNVKATPHQIREHRLLKDTLEHHVLLASCQAEMIEDLASYPCSFM
jgi:hypothetical protein